MAKNTKQLIINTYIRLLEESPSSHITVKDISEACGINRNTFYCHFKDILSLIEEIFRQGTEEMEKHRHEQPASLSEGVRSALTFANQHRTAVLSLYNSIGHAQFVQYLLQVCDILAHEAVDPLPLENETEDESANLKTYFYKCACVGLFVDWLHNDMTANIEAQLEHFHQLEDQIIEKLQ